MEVGNFVELTPILNLLCNIVKHFRNYVTDENTYIQTYKQTYIHRLLKS